VEVRALKQLLETLGLPVAITSFFKKTKPPAIVILPTGTEGDGSDFATELYRCSYQVELYTNEKDFALEEKLEQLLCEHGIHFEKYETYIDEEAIYQCAYDFSMLFRKRGQA